MYMIVDLLCVMFINFFMIGCNTMQQGSETQLDVGDGGVWGRVINYSEDESRTDDRSVFSIEELEQLSDEELIDIAKKKQAQGLLDEDENLLNRDQIINAIFESAVIKEEFERLSDEKLIDIAKEKGLHDFIVFNRRDELINALLENENQKGVKVSNKN